MLPAFFPKVRIRTSIQTGSQTLGRRFTVSSLCEAAGIECRVTGPSRKRIVFLRRTSEFDVSREPVSMGRVSIGVPGRDDKKRAILALGAMAYAVFDYVARESMRERSVVPKKRGLSTVPSGLVAGDCGENNSPLFLAGNEQATSIPARPRSPLGPSSVSPSVAPAPKIGEVSREAPRTRPRDEDPQAPAPAVLCRSEEVEISTRGIEK